LPTETPQLVNDFSAPSLVLPGVDGNSVDLHESINRNRPKAFLVMFICNHCPYVKAILKKLVIEGQKLSKAGIPIFAVCSNNAEEYPEDSFENMQLIAERYKFPFPYLHDKNQKVAKDFGAVCTPDFFGFNSDKILKYRGRLDDSGKKYQIGGKSELTEAMIEIAQTGTYEKPQIPSIGCSIKWQNS
jgi:peroxiredoxin